jgi:hypothetical protein
LEIPGVLRLALRTQPRSFKVSMAVERRAQQRGGQKLYFGMGMNDENLHGLMMADSPSTLNSQPTIEQPRLVAPTCRVKV